MSRNSRGIVALVLAVIFVFGPEIIGLKAAQVRAEGIGETWVAGIHPDIVTAVL